MSFALDFRAVTGFELEFGSGAPAGVTLTAARFDNTNTFYAHTVGRGAVVLTPARFDNSNTFYAATLTQGGATQALTPARFDNSNTFYSHLISVSGGPQTLLPDRFDNSNTFYAATVGRGAVTLTAARFDNSNTFYAATVTPGGANLAPARLDNTNQFYAATISVSAGPQTLIASRFDNTNLFFGATITGGDQQPGNQNGFVLVDMEPRQWWKRKPKSLPVKAAKAKIRRIAEVLDDVAEQQAERGDVTQAAIVGRIRPMIAEMPGFDWRPLYQALLEIRRTEMAKRQAEQAIQAAIRRAIEQDEEDVAILLLAM